MCECGRAWLPRLGFHAPDCQLHDPHLAWEGLKRRFNEDCLRELAVEMSRVDYPDVRFDLLCPDQEVTE